MAVKDIDIEENTFELRIVDGDFKLAESDQNHIMLLTKAYLGAFKQFPLVGVGIDYFISSSNQSQIIKRNIAVQLESDSYNKITIDIDRDTYSIDAKRIENT